MSSISLTTTQQVVLAHAVGHTEGRVEWLWAEKTPGKRRFWGWTAGRHPQAHRPESRATRGFRARNKGLEMFQAHAIGGGGGSRTRVRRSYTEGVYMLMPGFNLAARLSPGRDFREAIPLRFRLGAVDPPLNYPTKNDDPSSPVGEAQRIGSRLLSCYSVVVIIGV